MQTFAVYGSGPMGFAPAGAEIEVRFRQAERPTCKRLIARVVCGSLRRLEFRLDFPAENSVHTEVHAHLSLLIVRASDSSQGIHVNTVQNRRSCRMPPLIRGQLFLQRERQTGLMGVLSAIRTRILKNSRSETGSRNGRHITENQKRTPQRLAISTLTRGKAVRISLDRTCPAATGLAGWGGRTRTHKCHFRKCPLKCGVNSPDFGKVSRAETFRGPGAGRTIVDCSKALPQLP
jgi:hypothetical protein